MNEVTYIILERDGDTFKIIFVGESEKTTETDFFISNEKFKCWISQAGSENNLYLSIFPMPNSPKDERRKLVQKTIEKYNPICNLEKK